METMFRLRSQTYGEPRRIHQVDLGRIDRVTQSGFDTSWFEDEYQRINRMESRNACSEQTDSQRVCYNCWKLFVCATE